MININGTNFYLFYDNKKILKNKKSYLCPLIKIDENNIIFIRITTKIPEKYEKYYVEIDTKELDIKELDKVSYIRFDRKYSDIHIVNIADIWKDYQGVTYNEIFEIKYIPLILKSALNCKYISPMYLKIINEELKKLP
ncbi:hypothetical protein [Spiroplasma endosymbiont of Polydrusus pterygomalis]|uniref:hypothetical protein n=1 Tax=Spiroplasma endosymbiont of Polydrusus pterygomalis TaxID=3139327 RepID=UPI003CCB1F5F